MEYKLDHDWNFAVLKLCLVSSKVTCFAIEDFHLQVCYCNIYVESAKQKLWINILEPFPV